MALLPSLPRPAPALAVPEPAMRANSPGPEIADEIAPLIHSGHDFCNRQMQWTRL